MEKKKLIETIRKLSNILKPFVVSSYPGSKKWNGKEYVRSHKAIQPDPYILAWWHTLNVVGDLLETQDCFINELQQECIKRHFFGGMGSLNDLYVNKNTLGSDSKEFYEKFNLVLEDLYNILEGKAN